MLIAMNVGKQAISFGMGFDLLTWILTTGYAKVIAGAFVAILLLNNIMVPIFMWKGKAIRRFMARTWLAKLHRRTTTAREVA